jgi:archaeal flagellar protein FlaJ
MTFKIPFTISDTKKLKKRSETLKKRFRHDKKSKLNYYLKNIDSEISREEYLAIVLRSFMIFLTYSFLFSIITLYLIKAEVMIIISLIISLTISGFITLNQITYPKRFNDKKSKEMEKNLIPALQDMLVQLNSGIPLYGIMINISSSNYGRLSEEFKKIVKKINAGYPQIEVIEEAGEKSASIYFKRYLWQLSNGMRAGSDISMIIKGSIKSLNEEQLIQIQNYGNKLNPLIMFYMLISVIIPALSITFLTIISSMVGLNRTTSIILYFTLMGGVIFIQIMFLGIIKSIRPSLL